MASTNTTLSFDMKVKVEQRKGYFAARTNPFAITVYSDNKNEAEERALHAVKFLLDQHYGTLEDLSSYLNSKGVKHTWGIETEPKPRHLVRECKQEVRVEVPKGERG